MARLVNDNNKSNDSILSKISTLKKNLEYCNNKQKPSKSQNIEIKQVSKVDSSSDTKSVVEDELTNKLLEEEKKKETLEDKFRKQQEKAHIDKSKELFGDGFTDAEYKELYSMYQDYSNNYPTENSIHRRALIKVCKCTLRYDQALSSNDTDSIKIWNTALKDALNEAKINPSQLSAADLSEGLTSFSQLSARVEKMEGPVTVVDQLNGYIWEPQDLVDYTIWQYINYNMALVGKPLIKYKDVYNFMERQAEENHKRYAKFLKKEEEITDPSILDPLGDYE